MCEDMRWSPEPDVPTDRPCKDCRWYVAMPEVSDEYWLRNGTSKRVAEFFENFGLCVAEQMEPLVVLDEELHDVCWEESGGW